MQTLFGIKDVVAQAFINLTPSKSLELIKRELSNVVNTPSKNLLFTNVEDFQLFQLGSYDEETGDITKDQKFLLNLSELKINVN